MKKSFFFIFTLFIMCFGMAQNTQRKAIEDIEMVFVEGGTYWMGCADSLDIDSYDNERPIFLSTISDFNMSKTAITTEMYVKFLNTCKVDGDGYYRKRLSPRTYDNSDQTDSMNDPDRMIYTQLHKNYIEYVDNTWKVVEGYENYPMVNVTWYGAYEYCQWAGGRLPTEQEWEYAARGGQQSKGYRFAGSDFYEDVAWCNENSGARLHAVAEKMPNELGLFDMCGNTWEWCGEFLFAYTVDGPNYMVRSAKGPRRPARGGSWGVNAKFCRVYQRQFVDPGLGVNRVGFRIVQSVAK